MTREEALKVLEMFLHKQCDLERTKFAYDANTVWEAVNIANKALEQEPSPQWIPCSERLPNREEYIQCNGLFIVSDGDRAYAEYFDICDKKCFGGHTMYGFRADRAVIAWMPLPKYESEGER